MKVFWSWQADRSPGLHKFFVRDALQDAIDHIVEAEAIEPAERPEVDHDTLNEPGSPDIVRTINRKIAEAAVFVADVTPVGVTDPRANRPTTPEHQLPSPKYLQNPNVMIELGYADRAIGQERIMLVANSAYFPGPEALPFDWRHRRGPLTYRLEPGASVADIEAARRRLSAEIAAALPPLLAVAAADRPAPPPILTRVPSADDPAIWAGGEVGVRYNESIIHADWKTAHLDEGPRLYVRMRAESWPGLSRQEVGDRMLRSNVRLWIGGGYGATGLNANGGFSASGIVEMEPNVFSARGMTQWFADDGEVWAADCASFTSHAGQTYFSPSVPFPYFANFIDNALRALRGVAPAGRIEIEMGASRLLDSAMTTGMRMDRTPALADRVSLRDIDTAWSHDRRNALLHAFWNRLVDAYGRAPAPTLEDFERAAAVGLTRVPD